MATLALAAAGAAIGGGIGGAVLGVGAAAIGQALGAVAGQYVDSLLLGGSSASQRVAGPRMQSLDVMVAQEGVALPRVEGRARVAGRVIWATRIEEVATTTTQEVGGKGGGGQEVESTDYTYFASFAVAVAEGPVAHFGRLWADGKPLDISGLVVRFYHGGDAQQPDRLLEEKDGAAPAYRGTAYVVFERMPLAQFGRRIPQITFEVFGFSGDLESLVRGVDLIPGTTEWGYHPEVITQVARNAAGKIVSERPENAHRHEGISDLSLSVDMMEEVLPNADTVALVVAWFGDDLRAGLCEIAPRVEVGVKDTAPAAWSAGGLDRAAARVVSQSGGRPAFGSSPADSSVIEAIKHLRGRGKRVVLYPFIMMDIPPGTGKPSPWGGEQGAYPWRGRIAPDPAAAVADEVAAFAGSAAVSDFSIAGGAVSYAGPAEWGYRRFILHLAHLAAAAGGIDAMLVGSEMVGMTQATDAPGVYPFVDVLSDLARDVKAVLPAALVSYAADWSEYHSHRQGGDVWFNMDSLWASPHVDFVGIDNYLPLADWREGTAHLDYDADKGHTSQYSLDYLKSQVEGGEFFDWYYATEADRAAQVRTPINDGAHGEHWVYRQKDIRGWHGAAHHNRPGGVRDAAPTAWAPGAKPVWFTELGAPAVDKAANQPNAFFSANSSEGAYPHHSSGARDDFAQRQFLRAALEWWGEHGAGVVDPAGILIWAWDARPWPEFPTQDSVWADGPDWSLGHWLNGRAGAAPAREAIARRLALHGFGADDLNLADAHGQVDGYATREAVSFREWFQPLELLLALDAFEDFGALTVRARIAAPPAGLVRADDMVDAEGAPRFTATRRALADAPGAAVLRYVNGLGDYESAAVRAAIEEGPEVGLAVAETPLVLDQELALPAVESWLRKAAGARERIAFALPPSAFGVRPGRLIDVLLPSGDRRTLIVESVTEGAARAVVGVDFDAAAINRGRAVRRGAPVALRPRSRSILMEFLDLPLLADQAAPDWRGYVAAHADPWPGGAVLLRSPDEFTGYQSNAVLGLRAAMGETATPLEPGRLWAWSGESVDVRMFSGGLVTRPRVDVLNGANALAVKHPAGWEVVQFRAADLVGPDTWRLSGLLRGQRGTESVRAAAPLPPGASVVALDAAVAPVAMSPQDVGRAWWWKYGPAGVAQDDASFRTASHAFAGLGRRPFSPVHLRAAYAGGDVILTWTRRTRIEGDRWPDVGDSPLGESSLAWRVEIGPADDPARVAEIAGADVSGWTYSAAMQAADGLTGPAEVRVAQVSETFGPGVPARMTINI
ncbi:baseplate multidomain protein megatron [Oceanicella actignis]|uniref:Putative phage tail protein n=1 Tax=Oceanicella actignis TaxID=1189325 RepID=A0A1M7U1P2_9RHOB|nr:glycoside hydrolase TIM-barrel-like domain-containing protein [Oceanicella actignis]SES77036.1 Putative phage tail protein [Oceanicella actignis]SHN76854.1 Putative phage tail protein [Oceanicella actignis]